MSHISSVAQQLGEFSSLQPPPLRPNNPGSSPAALYLYRKRGEKKGLVNTVCICAAFTGISLWSDGRPAFELTLWNASISRV